MILLRLVCQSPRGKLLNLCNLGCGKPRLPIGAKIARLRRRTKPPLTVKPEIVKLNSDGESQMM